MAASGQIEIVMPRMGLTMEEGTVVAWLKPENGLVHAGEPLLEIETDKSTVEIEAPASGRLGRILVPAGGTVPVGEVIGYLMAPESAAAAALAPQPAPADAAASNSLSSSSPSPARGEGAAEAGAPAAGGKLRASPAARALARVLKVDLAQAEATGPGGRVVAWNVQALADSQLLAESQALADSQLLAASAAPPRAAARVTPLARKVAAEMGVDASRLAGAGPSGWVTRADVQRADDQRADDQRADGQRAEGQRIPAEAAPAPAQPDGQPGRLPLSRSQKVMAERMAASFGSAPHFYLHVDVDCRKLVALRERLLPKMEARRGVRPTYTDLLVKFAGLVLPRHPRLLQQWAGDGLAQFERADIGVAMDAPGGLVVPVIRDAAHLDLAEITRQRLALAERAHAGRLQPQEMELGVFTLSNLGMFGIDAFDAILNPPQAAILAVGRIKERALAVDGQVIAAPAMTLSLSVDHRVLDGAGAARFLGELVELIEDPEVAVGY